MLDVASCLDGQYGPELAEVVRGIDWAMDVDVAVEWLSVLLQQSPLPAEVRALWFDVPDTRINDAMMIVCGHDRPGTSQFDHMDEPEDMWDSEPTDESIGACFALRPLQRVRDYVLEQGWLHDMDVLEELTSAIEAIEHSFVALLVLESLPKVAPELLFRHHVSLGVTMGYASGDLEGLGVLSAEGWSSFREAPRREVRSEALDPNSASFDVRAYIAAGGDVHARTQEGMPLLAACRYSEAESVIALVEAGADVNALMDNERPVFSGFVGMELDVLHAMLDAGARVGDFNRPGESALAWALSDGRCTVENLQVLLDAGASVDYVRPKDGRGSLHDWVSGGIYSRVGRRAKEEMLDCLIEAGAKMEARDSQGLSPLWVAIDRHVAELDDIEGWFDGTFEPRAGVHYFYRYDEIAIMLLERGADANARLDVPCGKHFRAGATPIMCPRYDSPKLHEALIQRGADVAATDSAGRSALDVARGATESQRCDRIGAGRVLELLEGH